MRPREQTWIDYTNYRGERDYRRVHPLKLSFGSNEWHPVPQWMLEAMDLDKSALRTFAMAKIHDWFSIEEIETAEALLREKVSTSFLQRKMMIGYNRAASIMTMFEKRGLVSEPTSAGVRTLIAAVSESAVHS